MQLDKIKKIKAELESAKIELDICQRRSELGRASELRYGLIPSLERQLPKEFEDASDNASSTLNNEHRPMVRDKVTAQDIADLMSRSTGIPLNVLKLFI